uniref:Peripheral-type benzodiazepine receptor-associated protein 1 n=1 Tax=Varanus komodoensis TaxID=61221 RepID=A0A8D2KT34_VARKO
MGAPSTLERPKEALPVGLSSQTLPGTSLSEGEGEGSPHPLPSGNSPHLLAPRAQGLLPLRPHRPGSPSISALPMGHAAFQGSPAILNRTWTERVHCAYVVGGGGWESSAAEPRHPRAVCAQRHPKFSLPSFPPQRKSCFPETQEKVRQLKRKNAELAVIAKRLEERAQKLQEANLKVVRALPRLSRPTGSCTGLCRKALARQQATDLRERASLLLAKDKQISALQQECQELQAKISSGKGGPHPPLQDFRQLLRESQKEVLRLQRQIALKEAKASRSPGLGDAAVALAAGSGPPTRAAFICSNGFESELRKKRKQCENLEHEVRKKHKKYAELPREVRGRFAAPSGRVPRGRGLGGSAEREPSEPLFSQVESENADLRRQVAVVTEERDLARQEARELQSRLESLGQVLERTREVAERSRQLEREHEEALEALREKRDEVHRLRQAQEEARSSHEGAVQLLEARVRELEDQCRSHAEQFSCLSQELRWFRLHAGKTDLLLLSPPPSLETSGAAFTACPSGPPLPDGSKEEGSTGVPPLASKKAAKKPESQSSSSRSDSPQNSPKSCSTPEVDTASEVEELEVDSVSLAPETTIHSPMKLRVFLARYSYDPFDGPNENPEAELPLTAGEYIYVYGEMDEDGFFEGSPDAPLDVRVEPGPMPGILVISWLPVTIDAEGSSNGLRVTGYAVYADGQKVLGLHGALSLGQSF